MVWTATSFCFATLVISASCSFGYMFRLIFLVPLFYVILSFFSFFFLLLLLFFLSIFLFFFLLRFFFPFKMPVVRVSFHYTLLLHLGLGPARFLWHVQIYPGGVCTLDCNQSLHVLWFTEETHLDEWINNTIRNFLDVDSVVAMVMFTIYFVVSFFHVEAKFVLK